jgi:precorrin-6B methylase 2
MWRWRTGAALVYDAEVSQKTRFLMGTVIRATLCAALLALACQPQTTTRHKDPDVPYVPTPQEVVDEMLKLADIKKGDVLYDLGCGDGRIVVTAAQRYGIRAVGVDINPERIKEANENARKAGVLNRVKFIEGDLFETDFKEANVMTLYLLPGVNMKLRPKIQSDLKAGSRVVSHSFDMGDWEPDKTVDVDYRKIYLWVIKK